MSTQSKIEWTDTTWNPVTGCTKVSPGCDHCYAERMTERFHGKGSFATVKLHPDRLDAPLKWRKPRRVFVNSMSDLFHADVPDRFIEQTWATMGATPRHTYQVLTKRHARMRTLLSSWTPVTSGPPYANVHIGVSVENQQWADIRIPALRDTPAALRFLSCEPLLRPLGDIDLTGIGWVIVGGESGPGARPMNPNWVRSLRDQCAAAGVPFFFKQWGEWAPTTSHGMRRVGKKNAGRELDGRTWNEYPVVTS